jgi:hypothetical protein
MNFKLSEAAGCIVRASDGEAGVVEHFYFDDLTWIVRYIGIKLKGKSSNRTVLVPSTAFGKPDWEKRIIPLNLTMTQVFSSPDIAVDEPILRQHEIELYNYYAWPGYWGGSFYVPFGYDAASFPARSPGNDRETSAAGLRKGDPHLRCTRDAMDCKVHASDGVIGKIEDFLVINEPWAIRYLVVNTGAWLNSKSFLVSPHWISKVDWGDQQVFVNLTQETIKESPKYDPSSPVSDVYEGELRDHFQKLEIKEWVQFKFQAPSRAKVYLAGTFNNWDPTGIKLGYHGKGIFSTMVLLPLGTYEYKFIVNGVWRNSPDCSDQVPNAFGTTNSRLIVSRKIIHDVHTHTFARMPGGESHRLWGAST